MPKIMHRLPDTVQPSNYDMIFDVDMENFSFSGKERIAIDISAPAKAIILNALDLKITTAAILVNNKILPARVEMQPENQILILKLPEKIRGKAEILLEFRGKLNDSLVGFYRTKVVMPDGSLRYAATTHFEAPYARRAFPCFDEPNYKASFDVTLKMGKKFTGISNMPAKKETLENEKKIILFQKTPVMSTYLLYLGIGEFDFEETRADNTLIRVATVGNKKGGAKFALDVAKKALLYFEKYSSIPYPLPKLDMIALPDFSSGAMENWGAVTFREIYLLYDEKKTSTSTKKFIAMIVAHELWHQWSGDLVTMKWWNDLWLNESFATFMAYKAVDHMFPEWNMWEDFLRLETVRALDDDSLKTTHPIEANVKNVHEIEQLFDAISYAKGGNILRMIEDYLGHDAFRIGVSRYLEAHKYGNASSEDLWDSLAAVSEKPAKDIVISWIKQAGYPMVEASMKRGKLHVMQKRFVFGGKDGATTWKIPLIVMAEGLKAPVRHMISNKTVEMNLDSAGWFKANYGQTGFYRVSYDKENSAKMMMLVQNKQLDPLDRWGLQDDIFRLSLNGMMPLKEYLEILGSYGNEDTYLILGSISANMRSIHSVFSEEPEWKKAWHGFSKHYMEPYRRNLEKLTWNARRNEPQEDALMRELAIRYLIFVKDEGTMKKAVEMFDRNAASISSIPPDLRYPAMYAAALAGGEQRHNAMMHICQETRNPEERSNALLAMGQFTDPKLLNKLLDFSVSGKARIQDLPAVFASLAANPSSRTILIAWMEKNWASIEKYSKSGPVFLNIIEYFINAHVTQEQHLRDFFASHPVKYKAVTDRAFERLKRSAKWLHANKKAIVDYFLGLEKIR
ncbi:MAG: M1 family metallopeptidase [Candidatus Aenigmarchaeota archaeon]|nr:M1 family metallopeptidase [Candidatus Aenigmarchaeota archaeon]